MRLKLSINGKMILYILGTAVLVYGSAFIYIASELRTNNYNNTIEILDIELTEVRNHTQTIFNKYLESTLILSNTFSGYETVPEQNRRELISGVIYSFIKNDTSCSSIWTEWKPLTIDSLDALYVNAPQSTVIGNFDCEFNRLSGSVELNKSIKTNELDICTSEIFTNIQTSLNPEIVKSYDNSNNDNTIKAVAPIIANSQLAGIVGIGISTDLFIQTISNHKAIEGEQYYIISNDGDFVFKTDSLNLSKSFSSYAPYIEEEFGVAELVKKGSAFDFESSNPNTGEQTLFIFKPIVTGNTVLPWSVGVSIPLKEIHSKANKSLTFTILIALIGFIIILLVILRISRSISDPIKETTVILQKIAHGNITGIERLKMFFNDEISDLAKSINKLIDGINSSAKFAHQIGEGNLNADYKLLGDKDALGTSLIAMQKSLILAKGAEDEKRVEDEKRNWVIHGLAKFGEVIRQHNDNMSKFTMNVAQNLVEYVGVSQVAIYINKQIEDENSNEDTYGLKAAIAYGKEVMINKEFEKGHELLGRAIDEKKTIYLKDLPEQYVLLSPGMKNEKRPGNLLIIPMHINNISMGVLELLSYDNFQDYQIDFLEKLSENISSVISSVKTNFSTSKLLEQSQFQADELAQHEEEMRQNLEEMQATQEEASKKQDELKAYIKSVKDAVMIAELSIRGRIVEISPSMSATYGASTDNMRGNYFEGFVAQDKASQVKFAEFWDGMIDTGAAKRKHVIKQRNNTVYLLESYTVIRKDGQQPKVLVLVVDKTKEKEINDLLKAEIDSNNKS